MDSKLFSKLLLPQSPAVGCCRLLQTAGCMLRLQATAAGCRLQAQAAVSCCGLQAAGLGLLQAAPAIEEAKANAEGKIKASKVKKKRKGTSQPAKQKKKKKCRASLTTMPDSGLDSDLDSDSDVVRKIAEYNGKTDS